MKYSYVLLGLLCKLSVYRCEENMAVRSDLLREVPSWLRGRSVACIVRFMKTASCVSCRSFILMQVSYDKDKDPVSWRHYAAAM